MADTLLATLTGSIGPDEAETGRSEIGAPPSLRPSAGGQAPLYPARRDDQERDNNRQADPHALTCLRELSLVTETSLEVETVLTDRFLGEDFPEVNIPEQRADMMDPQQSPKLLLEPLIPLPFRLSAHPN
jgi:hypothetical protein